MEFVLDLWFRTGWLLFRTGGPPLHLYLHKRGERGGFLGNDTFCVGNLILGASDFIAGIRSCIDTLGVI